MMPPAIRQQLALLRESCVHSEGYQCWLSKWWAGLTMADRRLLLAFVGQDDSEENARRPWEQHRQDMRDAMVKECRRLWKLLDVLRFA